MVDHESSVSIKLLKHRTGCLRIGVEESPAIDNLMLWIIRVLLVFSAVFLALGLVMLAIE